MKATYVALLCILMLACKKNKEAEPFDNDPVLTRVRTMIVRAPWRKTLLEYRNSDGSWASKPLTALALSYRYSYVATDEYGGTFTVYAGANVVQSTNLWQIIGDRTQLNVNRSYTYEIGTLDEATMQLFLLGNYPYTDPATGIAVPYYGIRETYGH